MATKTIGLHEDVYEALKARKRSDESFTDLVDRLLDESSSDWRDGFGTLPDDEAEELERVVTTSRSQLSDALEERQTRVIDDLRSDDG